MWFGLAHLLHNRVVLILFINKTISNESKKMKYLIISVIILVFAQEAAFADYEKEIELTFDYFSKYIWRGQNLVDDDVFQTGLSVIYNGLTLSVWGSMEMTNINDNNNEFTEVDYSIDYSGDLPGISGLGYSIGLIYYDFPNTHLMDTAEAYWGFNFDLPASPSITCYHDLDEAEGTYISFGVGHSVEQVMVISPDIPVAMEIGASLGWASGSYDRYYWGIDKSKMNDFVLSASFPVELSDWTITPGIYYVTLLSDEIRSTDAYGTDSDFFFAGVGILKRF